MDKLQLEIVTPDRLLLRESVDEVQIPAKGGYIGVLPGHAPLIAEMQIGEISYHQGKAVHWLAVAWGYCEVLPDRVIILAEKAEKAEEIDLKRAQSAKERAEKRLSDLQNPDIDFDRAAVSLMRAVSRIRVASKRSQG